MDAPAEVTILLPELFGREQDLLGDRRDLIWCPHGESYKEQLGRSDTFRRSGARLESHECVVHDHQIRVAIAWAVPQPELLPQDSSSSLVVHGVHERLICLLRLADFPRLITDVCRHLVCRAVYAQNCHFSPRWMCRSMRSKLIIHPLK